MSILEELGLVPWITKKIENGETHRSISRSIKEMFPLLKGTSARSVRRLCNKFNLHHSARLPDHHLSILVSWSVGKVGSTYGRKMLSGFLSSQGFRSSEIRVGESLKKLNPSAHSHRQVIIQRSLNPIPYKADYFGQKLHIDQNEKIVMYGVTHVCAIDGYSKKIVGFVSMPIKSNGVIYDQLYRYIVTTYGLWDRIIVDKGKEWCLLLFVNEMLSSYRYDQSKLPHLQTTSKKNHTIERIWVEVNLRVNYPLKRILNRMVENEDILLGDPMHQFCTSWLSLHVSNVGTRLFVSSWNAHRIPGNRQSGKCGIPNQLMNKDNRAKKIPAHLLPQTTDAVRMYTSAGGSLSDPGIFGVDPLAFNGEKQSIRQQSFVEVYSFENLFYAVSSGTGETFVQALKYLIDITRRLSLSD